MGINLRQHEPHRVRSHLHCVRSCYRCWSPCGQWSVATWASSCPFSPPLSPLCSAVAQPFSTLSCLRWVDWQLVAEHYETDISLMNMMTKCTWFSHQAAVNHFVSESVVSSIILPSMLYTEMDKPGLVLRQGTVDVEVMFPLRIIQCCQRFLLLSLE